MPIFKKESLEALRNKVDLIALLEPHLELKKSGASYKACCPFHDEKSPSFTVQRGDHHYHCFGCGAHGDAIQFLMQHLSMSFSEAVEHLAERFQVSLEFEENPSDHAGPSKKELYEVLEAAAAFYHTLLFQTHEGGEAIQYLKKRSIDKSFIETFLIGYAPKYTGPFMRFLKAKGFSLEVMKEAGLIRQNDQGQWRDFFSDRIMFPIHSQQGRVIGFSARKFREETFGGKYINSLETVVFKKSRVLFGLNYSRRRIAKERRALIVEGQIDALRLIESGLAITVAAQGTAFGEGHVEELLQLGIHQAYLAFDSDHAGIEATLKVGNLLQKVGVEVLIVPIPSGHDPDSMLRTEGTQAFLALLEKPDHYLDFLVNYYKKNYDITSPAGKNEIISIIAKQIKEWNSQVMVHESLKKLAHLLKVPEELVNLGAVVPQSLYQKQASVVKEAAIDPHQILETDFLRLLLIDPSLIGVAKQNIKSDDLKDVRCSQLYTLLQEGDMTNLNASQQELLETLYKKRINKDKTEELLKATIQKILERNWLMEREAINREIQVGGKNEDEVNQLIKRFATLKQSEVNFG